MNAIEIEKKIKLGMEFYSLKNYEQSRFSFQEVLQEDPFNPLALYSLGVISSEQGDQEKAINYFEKAVKIKPDYVDALNNLGNAYAQQDDYEKAINCYQKSIKANPNMAFAYSNLGSVLCWQDKLEQANTYFQKAIEIKPDYVEALNSLANNLVETGNPNQAIDYYLKALKVRPYDIKTHHNLGWVLLLLGDLPNGFQEHEWRVGMSEYQAIYKLITPIWNGTDLNDKSIVIWNEQGLGDCIQFVRYAKLLRERGAEVTIAVQSSLVELLQKYLLGNYKVIDKNGCNLYQYDHHVSLMSLSRILNIDLDNIPKFKRYIGSPESIPARCYLPKNNSYRIGIAWGTDRKNQSMYKKKYCPPEYFMGLLKVGGISIYSLQVGEDVQQINPWLEDPSVEDLSTSINDFTDTAHFVSQLDLIITVDTSVAHLAGAMGKPVWALLPFAPDWRWLRNRADSPWYPSMRLFRQTSRGDWASVFAQVTEKLLEVLQGTSPLFPISKFETLSSKILPEDFQVIQYQTFQKKQIEDNLQLAKQFHAIGQADQAEQAYQQVLIKEPSNIEAWNLLGLLTGQKGNYDLAIKQVAQSLQINPDNVDALFNLAIISTKQGQLTQAAQTYQRILQIKPDHLESLNSLGNILVGTGDFVQAAQCYQRAIEINPEYLSALNNLGFIFTQIGNFEEGIKYYQKAIEIKPDFYEALNNLGSTLSNKGNIEESLKYYQKALQIKPDYVDALRNMGNSLSKQDRYKEAIEYYQKVVKIQPNNILGLNNLGFALIELGRLQEAIEQFLNILQIDPNYIDAHWNLAHVLLGLGDYQNGLTEYEWRFKLEQYSSLQKNTPMWDGSDIQDKSIALWTEQGLGDSINFVRYAQIVKEKGARVTICVQSSLVGLFQKYLTEQFDVVNLDDCDIYRYDYHASLLSLPRIFNTSLNNIPNSHNYINFTDPVAPHLLLPNTQLYRIGFAWSTDVKNLVPRVKKKCCTIEYFVDFLSFDSVELYSLQLGEDKKDIEPFLQNPRIHDLSGLINDFTDTASLISQLDLVITIDTAIAHLAGAMGKPVWLLLLFAADWRWLTNRQDSPWYPTMRLFRQTEIGNWESVFTQVKEKLVMVVQGESPVFPVLSVNKEIDPDLLKKVTSIQEQIKLQNTIQEKLQTAKQFHSLGKLSEAEVLYKEIIQLDPSNAEVWHFLGLLAGQAGNYPIGSQLILKSLQLKPDNLDAIYNLGFSLSMENKLTEAIEVYQKVLQIRTDYLGAILGMGEVLLKENKIPEALSFLLKGLEIKPDNLDLLNKFLTLLEKQEQSEQSKELYAKVFSNLGNTLNQQGKIEQAIVYYQQAIKTKNDFAIAHFNLGITLNQLGKSDSAIQCYRDAIEIQPDYADAFNNLGITLIDQGNFQDALDICQKGVAIKPEVPILHYNLAYILLLLGDLKQGFQEYQWRLKIDALKNYQTKTPMWDGSDVDGKSIVLWSEQGLGDCIQFVRYALLLKAQGARVIISVPPSLVDLFRDYLLDKFEVLNMLECDIYSYDYHISMLSLSYAFETTLENIPSYPNYITLPDSIACPYIFPESNSYRIGIVWSSSNKAIASKKCCSPKLFIDLLDLGDIHLYSLQLGQDSKDIQPFLENPRIDDLGPHITNFLDTATLINQLDLVITIDTAIAHLAGAMGKKVWTLLPFVADWRWLTDRKDTPWYPSMSLFRQTKLNDWESAFNQVKEELKKIL